MVVVSIKFKEDGKPYFFESGDLKLEKEDYFIVGLHNCFVGL